MTNRSFQMGLVTRVSLVITVCIAPLAIGWYLASGNLTPALSRAILSAIILGGIGIFVVVRQFEESLNRLERATQRFAAGDLTLRVYPPRISQLARLAQVLNAMAADLQTRMTTLTRLSSEQDAILRSMIEGMITVDKDERVRRVNDAAKRMLDIGSSMCEGRFVKEVIRYAEVRHFISESVASGEARMETIGVRDQEERFLEVYSCPLHMEEGEPPGTLIVFHDVTHVSRLERIRRDFVANVSHELRTPITSIKGFVETLLDGADEDIESRTKFLTVIARHAERLNAIVDDLLTLARLESQEEGGNIEFTSMNLAPLLAGVIESHTPHAASKNITLTMERGKALRAEVSASLLEQAVVNLIDNAIKHTDAGGRITLSAKTADDLVVVSVTDTGCGIEAAHLSRLFERFYRVDRGRSRRAGGTGLGLAIVKHIMQVHGGRVEVTSVPGSGSTFTLFIPKEKRQNLASLKNLTAGA